MPLPYASTDVDARRHESNAGPSLLEPATSAFAGAPSAAVAHPTRLDVAYARTYGMTSSGIRPTLVGVLSQLGLALRSVTDVAPLRTRVRSDTPMPLNDVS